MCKEIDLRELKQVANLIFDHIIDDLAIERITIDEAANFYWEVPDRALNAVGDPQPQLDIGCLSDDFEFLSMDAGNRCEAPSLLFVHVAPLLRYLARKIGQ